MQHVEYISTYTRQEAIEDGFLVDVSETAKEAGIKFPVAMTKEAFEDCVAWSEEDNKRKQTFNDEDGRLWDVVYMLSLAIRSSGKSGSEITYQVYRIPRAGKGRMARRVDLYAQVTGGDSGEPVITIDLKKPN